MSESSVKLPSRHVCRGFLPSVFRGNAFGSDRQKKNPMNYSKRGPDEARLWGLALHDKSKHWLFKEHSCVKFSY